MISRRSFFKYMGIAGAAALSSAVLAGCSQSRGASGGTASSSETSASGNPAGNATGDSSQASSSAAAASTASPTASSIVVYFSHAGENYGVGYVEEGNTAIVAKMIAERTGSDMFEIAPAEAYPEDYDECCDVALEEQHGNARPAYIGDVDLAAYATVYLGYPIWWGDLPMCAYTFIESHDWAGKTVRPFCTHAGSGLADTVGALGNACKGATVTDGLSITGTTAQNSRADAQAAVDGWLA